VGVSEKRKPTQPNQYDTSTVQEVHVQVHCRLNKMPLDIRLLRNTEDALSVINVYIYTRVILTTPAALLEYSTTVGGDAMSVSSLGEEDPRGRHGQWFV
jgi:hypothetical protein